MIAVVAAAAHNLAAASCRPAMLGCAACSAKILHARPKAAIIEALCRVNRDFLAWQPAKLLPTRKKWTSVL